eukprot:scaffold7161_cov133-Cylindrotheca_fusiformis.AAC.8
MRDLLLVKRRRKLLHLSFLVAAIASSSQVVLARPETARVSTGWTTNQDHSKIFVCKTSMDYLLQLQEQLRGGGGGSLPDYNAYSDDENGEYDTEEEEDEEEEPDEIYHRRSPSNRKTLSSPPLPPSSSGKKRKPKHWTQRMAEQSMQMGGKLAWNTIKQPGKLAYLLIRPKHVDLEETGGVWRMDQQVTMKGDRQVASVASIEMNPRKRLVILRQKPPPPPAAVAGEDEIENDSIPKDIIIAEPYTFTKSRLGFYKTSFVAPAFLVGDKPRLYGYKGTWQRKVANTQVIKLVGNIYNVKRQRFGRQKGKYLFDGPSIGTFVARRRIQMEDESDDDYYDEEEEYDVDDQEYYDEAYDVEDGDQYY